MKLNKLVPVWAHPRSPLVALSLRTGNIWDYRIARFSDAIMLHLSSIRTILIIALPILGTILFAAGSQFLSSVLFAAVVILGPLVIVTTELLYLRLWFATPPRSSDLIAGEIQRRTWDIICSTPFPRYQIVIAKLAALFWMALPSLRYIFTMRVIFFILLFIEAGVQRTTSIDGNYAGWVIWLGLLILMPLLEFTAISSIGLFVSASVQHVRLSELITLLSQAFSRVVLFAIFITITANISQQWLLSALIVPHWTFMPQWFTYSSSFILALVLAFGILPLSITIGMIALTVWRVQN